MLQIIRLSHLPWNFSVCPKDCDHDLLMERLPEILESESFNPCQSARTAQADMGRYTSYLHISPPPFFREYDLNICPNVSPVPLLGSKVSCPKTLPRKLCAPSTARNMRPPRWPSG